MPTYTSYGLAIDSDIPLQGLVPTDDAHADVVVCRGEVEPAPAGAVVSAAGTWCVSGESRFFDEAGAYLVRGGREIVFAPNPGSDEDSHREAILGRGLGILLHQRGYLVLHADAVALNGVGVVCLGTQGVGKSTLAAALHARGHSLIADDVVAVAVGDARAPTILPGVPRFKLWPDSAARIGHDPAGLPRVHPLYEKRIHRPPDRFARSPVPLGRAYVLAAGDDSGIDPLSPQDAFLMLAGHSYTASILRATGASVPHLRQCASLISRVPIRRLRRRRSLQSLPDLARAVEEDLEAAEVLGPGAPRIPAA